MTHLSESACHGLLVSFFLVNCLLLINCASVVRNNINNDDQNIFPSPSSSSSKLLSDHWIMKMSVNDLDLATKIAKEHNFHVIRRIGSLDGYFMIKPDDRKAKRSASSSIDDIDNLDTLETDDDTLVRKIESHPLIESIQKEEILRRTKRDFVELPINPAISHVLLDSDFARQQRMAENAAKQQQQQFGEDPYWTQMWYLNRNNFNPKLPDMNVTAAWALGYSGKGVSVTFLDDGLEWNHPDIMQNYDPKASTDINSNDDDPMPRYDDSNENKHGTRCAGEVAAVANNSVCGVGVAFNAGIGGIRMLDGDVTDSVEASSVGFNIDHIHIYSASWGPDDNGEVVDGPGPLARKAFFDGIQRGRNGLGSIFVWASGNGGRFNDSCACDGYANSIYTFSISSTSERGDKPWYLEECASTLATTYSSGDERNGEKEIITTDIRNKCTTKHTGTSAAAPLAAGIIALALEANPKLTWRDIMYIIVVTSRPDAISSNNYIVNRRGFKVSPRYGFGLMNAGRMVEVARTWTNVPNMISCMTVNSKFMVKTTQRVNSLDATLNTDACAGTKDEVNFIEQVEVIVTIKAAKRGELEVYLTSPMGTRSHLLPKRSRDLSPAGFNRWPFMTLHMWGEMPRGDWILSVSSSDGTLVQVEDYSLIIHGTKEQPIDYERFVKPDAKTVNCDVVCVGNQCSGFERECQKCEHLSMVSDNGGDQKCVNYCPIGYFADYEHRRCSPCHSSCIECNGTRSTDCTKCKTGLFTIEDGECTSKCPPGYFKNFKNQCEKCEPNCLECEYESTHCLKCREDLTSTFNQDDENDEKSGEKILALKENRCIFVKKTGECPESYYYDSDTNDCETCDITCTECSDNLESGCIKCNARRPYLQEGRCVSECESGFYLEESLGKCLRCDVDCEMCETNQNTCRVCRAGYKLNEDSNSCEISVLYDKNCKDNNCFECSGPGEHECIVCKTGYVWLDDKCTSYPIKGYFVSEEETDRGIIPKPIKCSNGCSRCNENECLSCDYDYKLVNGNCYRECDLKHYPTNDGKCEPCSNECKTCANSTYCLSCQNGKLFYNGKCVEKCPNGYFPNPSAYCEPCHYSCETCFGADKTQCQTCVENFKFVDNECKSQCPDATYYDNSFQECRMCNSSSCLWCIKSPNKCTKCAYPLALDILSSECKPCCVKTSSRRLDSPHCCECADQANFNGFCLLKLPDQFKDSSRHWNSWTVLFGILLLASICLLVFAIFYFKKSFVKNSQAHQNVKYSALVEDASND